MAIDILRNHAIQAMPESVASRSTKVAPKAPESLRGDSLSTPSPDDVILTAAAQTFSQATNIARESDGVDYDKVAYFKQQLEQGTYHVDATHTAAKMLAESDALSCLLNE